MQRTTGVEEVAPSAVHGGWIDFGLVVEPDARGERETAEFTHWMAGGLASDLTLHAWRVELPLFHARVARAQLAPSPDGHSSLDVELESLDSAVFRLFTARNIGRRLAVLVNGSIVATPRLDEPLEQHFRVSARFSREDVQLLLEALSRSDSSSAGVRQRF